jgi:endoglycosylceramidase
MEPGICDTGEILPHKLPECKVYYQRKLLARKNDANRLGVPIMISEWGACSGSQTCYDELNNVADVMDEYAASWAYWQYKGFGDFTTVSTYVQGMYQHDGSV